MDRNIDMPMKIGNRKIGDDTIVFNMCSASECPSAQLGLCQLKDPDQCYAYQDEVLWKHALPYRERQEVAWDANDVGALHCQIEGLVQRKRVSVLKYVRVSESGDFRYQGDVDKLSELANRLQGDMVVYTYTARRDLDFSGRGALVVNGSGFMVDNEFRVVDGKIPSIADHCNEDCRECNMCKEKGGRIIYETLRIKKVKLAMT
jgi:hypothetical protein